MTALIEQVSRYCLATDVGHFDEEVVEAARCLLLDAIGVGIVGKMTTESETAFEIASAWGQGAESCVWGRPGHLLPAGSAAFVNAHQMHCLEFDAINEPAVVHPTTVVLPVIAAWTQRARSRFKQVISGSEFLSAFAVGIDIAAGLGDVVSTPLQFFRPATAGAFGGVAALCNLMRPAPDVATAAFGVVYGALSGTMQPHTEGAQVLALQVAFNARAAVHAMDLAAVGFRGPRFVLEGEFGYFRLIEAGGEPERLVAMLGRDSEVTRTSVKPFPSGRATHSALDGILQMREEHSIDPRDVDRVEVLVPPMVHRLVGRPPTSNLVPGAARLCLSYLVAHALYHGGIDLDAYRPACLHDGGVLDLASRIRVSADSNPDPNAFNPQTIMITLHDGRRLERTMVACLGSPERPLDGDKLQAKFESNLAVAGRAEVAKAIRQRVDQILELQDVTALLDLL